MYFTLDKIDSVATGENEKYLVQTDHREAEEIAEEGPLSHLFALAKIAGAAEYGKEFANARVLYVCQAPPPLDFQQTVAAAGAELHVGELGNVLRFKGERADAAQLLNRYMGELAGASGIADAQQLAVHERQLAEELAELKRDLADDPEAVLHPYWRSVIELAAIAGSIIGGAVAGGHWRLLRLEPQTLPFLYVHDDPTNPEKVVASFIVEKAMKFFDEGAAESVAFLTRTAVGIAHGRLQHTR